MAFIQVYALPMLHWAFVLLVVGATPQDEVYEIQKLDRHGDRAFIRAKVYGGTIPVALENRLETIAGRLLATDRELRSVDLLVSGLRQPPEPPAVSPGPRRPAGGSAAQRERRDRGGGPGPGALSGRVVALSPGHGEIYYETLGAYAAQRSRLSFQGCGDCAGVLEDEVTHRLVVSHLVPLLEGAGAEVLMVRERSRSAMATIADDAGAAFMPRGTFSEGSSLGGHGGGYQFSESPQARALFTIQAPHSGDLLLSTWFVPGTNRSPRVGFEIETGSGTYVRHLDQRRLGRRWAPLGHFEVEKDEVVRVTTAAESGVMIADAVRMGAPKHSSGPAMWRMGALPFAEYQRADPGILTNSDVTVRPIYAESFGADVYVSIHSNATGLPDADIGGTSTYRYSCQQVNDHRVDVPRATCDEPTGSSALQGLIQTRVMEVLRKRWDPHWRDHGQRAANFGELRALSSTPGALVEIAFHDNLRLSQDAAQRMTDNQALQDPRFLRAAARGLYEGISEFLVGAGPLLLDPPRKIRAFDSGGDQMVVDFEAVDGATEYLLEIATDAFAFSETVIVQTPPAVIDRIGSHRFARVAAVNAAGRGLFSRVVGAAFGDGPRVLVVDAFEREDAWVGRQQNPGDIVRTYGVALGVPFDSASESATHDIDFDGYDGVVVALGNESTEHGVMTSGMRDRLGRIPLFVAGSELAWALGRRGDSASAAWLKEKLGLRYSADDAGAYIVEGLDGAWVAETFTAQLRQRGDAGPWARSSDVFEVEEGGLVQLRYQGGGAAAVRKGRSIALGFSLEALVSVDSRKRILGAWTERLSTSSVGPAPIPVGVFSGQETVEVPGPETPRQDESAAGGCRSTGGQAGWLFVLLALCCKLAARRARILTAGLATRAE